VHGGEPFSRLSAACNQIHCGVPVECGAERDSWHAPHEKQIVIGEKANRLRHTVIGGGVEPGFPERAINLVTVWAEIVGVEFSEKNILRREVIPEREAASSGILNDILTAVRAMAVPFHANQRNNLSSDEFRSSEVRSLPRKSFSIERCGSERSRRGRQPSCEK